MAYSCIDPMLQKARHQFRIYWLYIIFRGIYLLTEKMINTHLIINVQVTIPFSFFVNNTYMEKSNQKCIA